VYTKTTGRGSHTPTSTVWVSASALPPPPLLWVCPVSGEGGVGSQNGADPVYASSASTLLKTPRVLYRPPYVVTGSRERRVGGRDFCCARQRGHGLLSQQPRAAPPGTISRWRRLSGRGTTSYTRVFTGGAPCVSPPPMPVLAMSGSGMPKSPALRGQWARPAACSFPLHSGGGPSYYCHRANSDWCQITSSHSGGRCSQQIAVFLMLPMRDEIDALAGVHLCEVRRGTQTTTRMGVEHARSGTPKHLGVRQQSTPEPRVPCPGLRL
jgi:hypothetical protein